MTVPTLELEQETKAVAQEALTVVETANALTVRDNATRTQAAELGRMVAGLDKQAEEKFEAIKAPLNKARAEVLAWEHQVRDPLAAAKRYLSGQIGGYDARVEQARRAEEARLQAIARAQAEAEAKRIAEEQALQDAVELEAAGDTKGAEAVLANPVPVQVYVAPVIVPKVTPKAEGVSTRQNWKFKIVNADLIPRQYLKIDEQAIGQVVRALKEKTNIPGISPYPESGAAFRS